MLHTRTEKMIADNWVEMVTLFQINKGNDDVNVFAVCYMGKRAVVVSLHYIQ